MDDKIHVSMVAQLILRRRIDEILKVIELEKDHAGTHSARNAYQHVIRTEIQALRDQICIERGTGDLENDIPF